MDRTIDLLFSKFSYVMRDAVRRRRNLAPSSSNSLSFTAYRSTSLPCRSPIDDVYRRTVLHGCSISSGVLGFQGVISYAEDTQSSSNLEVDSLSSDQTNVVSERDAPFNEETPVVRAVVEKDTTMEGTSDMDERLVSYDTCYALCLQYATASHTSSFSSKDRTRIVLRFFSDVPYVPRSALLTVWKWLKGNGPPLSSGAPRERKMGLAALSCILRRTQKETEAKRTAYAMLLHLCFDLDGVVRQEALSFVHRKVLGNPGALGDIDTTLTDSSTPQQPSGDWNNYAAVTLWIESCTSLLLR